MSKAKPKKVSKPKPKAKPKVVSQAIKSQPATNVETISLKDIWMDGQNARDSGWQKKIQSLQKDIKKRGVMQPVEVARILGPNKEPYMLVFGHRRVMACRVLKRKHIDAHILPQDTSKKDIYRRRGAENAKRKNLSAMEIARELQIGTTLHKMAAKELAEDREMTVGWVSQHLQLLKLPEKVQNAVEDGSITATHAREIARVTDKKTQEKLLSKAKDMPVTDFKEHVATIDDDKKKDSNRGRKPRDDKPAKQPSVGEKGGVRTEKEVVKALGEVDTKLKNAQDKDNKLQQEYYKGMIRGITWTRKMGGAKKLL